MTSEFVSITEFADKHGISRRTLRFYEERGLISPKRDGRKRRYSLRDRFRLRLFLDAKRLGFTLAEIENLIQEQAASQKEETGELTTLLSADAIEQQLQDLRRQRARIDEAIIELVRLRETTVLQAGRPCAGRSGNGGLRPSGKR